MRPNRIVTRIVLTTLALLCAATMSFAVTIRGSSGNGVDSNVSNWLLLARSHDLALASNGKTGVMRRETICINQDVEDSLSNPTPDLSGTCDSGVYMFLFQFQSTATNLQASIVHLIGFHRSTVTDFGVLTCDSPNNTLELCTNDPTGTHIPNITVTTTTSSVTFTVPNTFPTYPAGTAQQGQGLTFFVIARQTTPVPMAFPIIGIR